MGVLDQLAKVAASTAKKRGSAEYNVLDELLQSGRRRPGGGLDLLDISRPDLEALAKVPARPNLVFHGSGAPLDLTKTNPNNPLFIARRPDHALYYAHQNSWNVNKHPELSVFELPTWDQLPDMLELVKLSRQIEKEGGDSWEMFRNPTADQQKILEPFLKAGGGKSAPGRIQDWRMEPNSRAMGRVKYSIAYPGAEGYADVLNNVLDTMDQVSHRQPQGFVINPDILQRKKEGGLIQASQCQCGNRMADGGLVDSEVLGSMSQRDLLDYRKQAEGNQELQEAIAPYEHRAFAREYTREHPVTSPLGFLATIPMYYAAKKLGLLGSRTPASLEQVKQGFVGVGEGLRSALTDARK